MASLVPFLKKAANVASRAYDQVNVLDNGLSATTRQVTGPRLSAVQQVRPIAKGIVRAPAQMLNTAALQIPQLDYTIRQNVAAHTGNTEAFQNASRALQGIESGFNQNKGGLFNAGTFYNQKDAQAGKLTTGLKKIGGGTLQTAVSVAPMTKGGSFAVAAGKGKLLRAIPKLAAEGAVYGAGGSVGSQLQENGTIDPRQIAQDTLTGAVLNAGLPVVARGARAIAPEAAKVAGHAIKASGKAAAVNAQKAEQKLASPDVLNLNPNRGINSDIMASNHKVQAVREGKADPMSLTERDIANHQKFLDITGIDPNDITSQVKALRADTNYQNTKIRRQGAAAEAVKSIKAQLPKDQGGYLQLPGRGALKESYHPALTPARDQFGRIETTKIDELAQHPDAKVRQAVEAYRTAKVGKVGTTDNQTTLDTLNPSGGVFVGYNPKARATAKLGKNITTLDKTGGGNADEMVTIYRGAPSSQKSITAGDFITTNKQLAESYGADNIIATKVRKGDILDDTTEPLGEEYIYRPKADKELTKPSLTDRLKSALPDQRGAVKIPGTPDRPLPGDRPAQVPSQKSSVSSKTSIAETKSITVDNHKYDLSDAALTAYKAAEAKYNKRLALYANDKTEFGSKQRKALGMQFTQEKRKALKSASGVTDKGTVESPMPRELQRTSKATKPTAPVPPKKQLPVSKGVAKPAPKLQAPAKPVVPDVKSSSNGKATNRLTQGGRDGRQELAPEVQGAIKGEHVQRNTAQLGAKANADISKLDDQTAIQAAHDRLNVDLGKIDDKDVAFTNEAIQRAQNAGRMEDAINLHDKLSEHLVKTGQTSQAASLLYRLSPDGIFYKAVRDLKKSGKEVTPELQTELKQQADAIKNATGTEAKQRATAKLGKTVADNIPKGRMNDILSVWKAGLLSGIKTQQGNAISNATFGVLKKISDVPSAAVDKGISLITGQRTKVATGRGIVSGGKEGIRKGIDTLKTGIDERNITGGKYEQHGELNFKNPIIQKIFGDTSNMVFRGMSAADQPFYYAAAKNNLYDLGLAEASNRGLKGTEKSSFVRNFVDNPPKSAAQRSKDAADKAVLGYDTVASKIISGAHQVIDRVAPSPAAKATAHTVVGVLAPFVKVPSAFISRTIDFTPAGPFKEAVNQISNKKFDQRALSEAIGQGITGTGVIALGVSLAQNKLISGNYPKSDPKEAQRWKAEGITPNSVKIGNKWISMNYLGPVGLLFNAGKQFHDAEDSAALGKVAASVGGIGQGLLGQSFLQGFSGFSDAINDPERNAKSFVNSQASSAIPAWVNDIANVTDKFQRQADTVGESIKNRIPVLRGDNKIKQDVYGNQLEQPAGQLNTLNGVKPSNSLTNKNPVVAEVSRLHDVDTKNPDLQVTPSQVQKTVTVNKETIKLDDKQRYDLQTAVGKATTDAWGKLIKTDEYKALDDTGKAKALSNLRTDTATLATREFVTSNNIGIYDKGVTDKLAKLGTNHENVASYAQSGSTSTSSTSAKSDLYKSNDAEYRQLVSKYEENKKAGTLSTASDIRAKDAISRAKVGKDYSKDTRDLYGLTKQQILSYISTNRDGNKIADDLKAYDQALYNAGLSTSLKFKNGFTSASKSSGKSGSTKFKVASLPKLSNRSVKIPKLRTPKVKLAKLTNKKAVYRSAKIASNVNAKLRLKTA